ncbi:hypothetical protein P8625_02875 [Tenacibaculum tangerinum]|uniref:Bacteriocin n=1 Tax=Tenacibaculum tangerinum TaxID=3038772 RepID=A0ABY8L671_9FLAO|nr:hypothetical protein [Tenacibaculum tangerinum]WGH76127.1 hypothetical protein P8625_02875 [Tenacibaculum tangerinum]
MLKNISNLGQTLSKGQQQSINGGGYYCFIYSFSDLVRCSELGGEIVYCAPHVECAAEI